MTDDLVKRLQWSAFKFCGKGEQENLASDAMSEAADRIELLEAALRTIDNAIPKNDPMAPAIFLVAGDIAEAALNGTWPAFGVMPRAALGEKNHD
jgi:hypothetical protein